MRPGAISRPASSPRPAASARRRASPASSTAPTGPAFGVILDWVPAHFPTDSARPRQFRRHAALRASRSAPRLPSRLEHRDLRFRQARGRQPPIANALFWLERFHIDGLRVDAVASMLYLDYSRKAGEWLPNVHGGRENLDAIAFLQRMNVEVYAAHPGVVTIAEEFDRLAGRLAARRCRRPRLRLQVEHGLHARHAGLYAARRRSTAAGTTTTSPSASSMPSPRTSSCRSPMTRWCTARARSSTRCRGWRARSSPRSAPITRAMWGYPGKKLLFMGQDFAQRREWNENVGLDWDLLAIRAAPGRQRSRPRPQPPSIATRPALHARDCEGDGFEWLVVDDAAQCRLRLGAPRGRCESRRRRPQHDAGGARGLYRCPCRGPANGPRSSTPMPSVMPAANRGNLGGVRASDRRMERQARPCAPPAAALVGALSRMDGAVRPAIG